MDMKCIEGMKNFTGTIRNPTRMKIHFKVRTLITNILLPTSGIIEFQRQK